MRSSARRRNLQPARLATLCAAMTIAALVAVMLIVAPSPGSAQVLSVEQINEELGVGVNFGNALEAPREGAWGLTIEADFFPAIAEAGFGHIRVPIRFSAYADDTPPFEIPDGIDPSVPNADNLWERIDWVIANAEANDLYVILDLHHYDELFDDVAGERARFLAIWEQVAGRYANASSRVLFEVLNEPHGQFNDDASLLNDLLADSLSIIRATNPTRPVLVGPPFWNNIFELDTLDLPDDPNLIVSVHFYEPFGFTHQGATWVNPVPPAPVDFDADIVSFGAGWDNWSWDTDVAPTSSALNVTYERQWAGLGFGRSGLVDPATLRVVASGNGELSVRCRSAAGDDVEADRITTTSASQAFNVDMGSCPDQTQSIALMMASATFDPLRFEEIELCEASGFCTRLIESGAQKIDSAFGVVAAWSQANDRPMNVGEFGAYSAGGLADVNERAEWTELVRRAGERHGISMSYWEFGAGYGVYDPSTSSWIEPLLQALGVTSEPPDEPSVTPVEPSVTPVVPSVTPVVEPSVPPAEKVCGGEVVTIDMNLGARGVGTAGDDVILGTSNADVINGRGGNDIICGEGGADTILGGDGADTIEGGGGDDRIEGGDGADVLKGGPGVDRILGGSGGDTIEGGDGEDRLFGQRGNDTIRGGGGDDLITGKKGNDNLFGGSGEDTIKGGEGDDTIEAGPGDDPEVNGGRGNDMVMGDGGDDVLRGNQDRDVVRGGAGDDVMKGGVDDDELHGGAGADTIFGKQGNDELFGNGNDDILWGGKGSDALNGGGSSDECHGGPGTDTATACEGELFSIP